MDEISNEVTLQRLREEIDEQDRALVDILARRFYLVDTITRLKRAEGIPMRDLERERQILEDRIAHGESAGLDASLVTRIFEVVLSHSARLQRTDPATLRISSDEPDLSSPDEETVKR